MNILGTPISWNVVYLSTVVNSLHDVSIISSLLWLYRISYFIVCIIYVVVISYPF